MHEEVPGNVGVLDEAFRVVAAIAILVSLSFLVRLNADIAIILVLGALPAVGYLLLSSAAHVDPIYMMVGIDTRHRHH